MKITDSRVSSRGFYNEIPLVQVDTDDALSDILQGYQVVIARWMAKLAEGAFLDLANSLAGQIHQCAYLLQGQWLVAIEAKIESDNPLLALVEAVEHSL